MLILLSTPSLPLLVRIIPPFLQICFRSEPNNLSFLIDFIDDKIAKSVLESTLQCDKITGFISLSLLDIRIEELDTDMILSERQILRNLLLFSAMLGSLLLSILLLLFFRCLNSFFRDGFHHFLLINYSPC